MADWVPSPPPFLSISPLESMQSGAAIPPLKRGISAILARYPMKTRQMGAIPPSAILSRKGIARYGGVSRTGPLSNYASGKHDFPNFSIRGEFYLPINRRFPNFRSHRGGREPKHWGPTLKTLTYLNKEVRLFFLSDASISSYLSSFFFFP